MFNSISFFGFMPSKDSCLNETTLLSKDELKQSDSNSNRYEKVWVVYLLGRPVKHRGRKTVLLNPIDTGFSNKRIYLSYKNVRMIIAKEPLHWYEPDTKRS
jgi:hypothetical protein